MENNQKKSKLSTKAKTILFRNIPLLILGSLILSFGIQLLVLSRMGSSGIDSFHYIIGMFFKSAFNINWEMQYLLGFAGIYAGTILLLLLYCIRPKKGLYISFIVLIFQGLLSFSLGFAITALKGKLNLNIGTRITLLIIGVLLVALSIFILTLANSPLGPYEEILLFLRSKMKDNVALSKITEELGFALISLILGVIYFAAFDRANPKEAILGNNNWGTVPVSLAYGLCLWVYDIIFKKINERKNRKKV